MYYVQHKVLTEPIPAMTWDNNPEELVEFLGCEPLEWVNGNPRVQTLSTTPVVQLGWTLYQYPEGLIVTAQGVRRVVYEKVPAPQ